MENNETNNKEMSMEEAMDGFKLEKVKDGDILTGKVMKVTAEEVVLNINYFADGIVPREELTESHDEDIEQTYKVDDEIKVMVLKADDGDGNVLLSKIKADAGLAKAELEEALANETVLTVKVRESVKGGLRVSYKGIKGFMPASLVADSFVEDLSVFKGQDLETYLIEYDESDNRVIFSRKAFLKKRNAEMKDKLLATLKEGQTVEGTVAGITTFGAFIDLGGVTGLCHISDLAHERVNHPGDVVKVGDKVKAHILQVNKKTEKISLSLKSKKEDPWNTVSSKLEGTVHEGRVKVVLDAGAIVDIGNGLEGFVHVSEISSDHVASPSDVLTAGDTVTVKVLKVDKARKRVSLSMREADGGNQSYYEEEDNITLGDVFKDLMEKFKGEE